MSERRGIERALANVFERAHGREPTDEEIQEGLGDVLEGIRKGPPPDKEMPRPSHFAQIQVGDVVQVDPEKHSRADGWGGCFGVVRQILPSRVAVIAVPWVRGPGIRLTALPVIIELEALYKIGRAAWTKWDEYKPPDTALAAVTSRAREMMRDGQ